MCHYKKWARLKLSMKESLNNFFGSGGHPETLTPDKSSCKMLYVNGASKNKTTTLQMKPSNFKLTNPAHTCSFIVYLTSLSILIIKLVFPHFFFFRFTFNIYIEDCVFQLFCLPVDLPVQIHIKILTVQFPGKGK